jgi:eukaryotic-like serine/threonine-protein kinase
VTDEDIPLEGRTVYMVRAARTPVLVGRRLGEGGQGVVHAAQVGGGACAVKWYRPVLRPKELRDQITRLIDFGSPSPVFLWPFDVVESDEIPGFGYVMPVLGPEFQPAGQLLAQEKPPPFRVMIAIGLNLVAAFHALHSRGLCYRDINEKNLQVDVEKAEVAIIDNDNVGVDNGEVFVRGTGGFMAPEVVRLEKLPTERTDLHSLAVLLFYLFVHGHPLEGMKADKEHSWSRSRESESQLDFLTYGLEPVFVFDPQNPSNPPPPGDPMLTWWPIYPRFFRELFEQSFTEGLVNPATGRVPEGIWRQELNRLGDCASTCRCGAAVFYDPDDPELRCWHCGQVPVRPPLLRLPGGTLVLSQGASVTSDHLYRDGNHDTVIGMVEAHPASPTDVVLRNVGPDDWTITPDGGSAVTVPPTRRLGVRNMVIDFGPVNGRITVY